MRQVVYAPKLQKSVFGWSLLVLRDVIFQGNVDFHEFEDKMIILEISADPQQI